MSNLSKLVFLCAILTIGASAFAQINIVNFDFGAVPIFACSGYAYEWPVQTCQSWYVTQNFNDNPNFGWTLSQAGSVFWGLAGLTGPNTAFGPPSFQGMPFSQAVFLQGAAASVKQTIGEFSPGTYTLSFYLGSRNGDGNQTVNAMVDGNVIGTWALHSGMPFTLESVSFTVNARGTHTLEFRGMTLGDHTAFLSYVVITPTER